MLFLVRRKVGTRARWKSDMLDWLSDKLMEIVTFVPALFVDQKSPNFELVRAMFGLLFIAAAVYVIAVLTSRRRRH
jgi:hypothetical protein